MAAGGIFSEMKRICVYCGSSPGNRPEYREAVESLATALVERELGLVYGGASVGIMGAVADAVLSRGGEVIGVIPRPMATREIAHPGLTELVLVESMHQRKAMMAERADGFIALPGGLGTLEELFEILTWGQLGIHHKPCGVLNIGGYYDSLLGFLDQAVDAGFVKPIYRQLLLDADNSDQLLDLFRDYCSPVSHRWLPSSAS